MGIGYEEFQKAGAAGEVVLVRSRESGVIDTSKWDTMGNFKNLLAYQKAYKLAMKIFKVSKTFPVEEKYSLISQIRNSSRSVCANIAEAYRRREHQKHYISKLNDSETENTETEVWIDFAWSCHYVSKELHLELIRENDEVGKLLTYMIKNPEKFGKLD